jgi:uncharacterized protein YfiM (DUF2279 family)
MRTLAPIGVQSLHDHVVSLVAQRWARSFRCNVTIRSGAERNDWTGTDKSDSDIIGWQFSSSGNKVEWVAEVETEGSLSDPQTRARLQVVVALGVPFYLFVPRNYRRVAQTLAMRAVIQFNGIYEYNFENEAFQIS